MIFQDIRFYFQLPTPKIWKNLSWVGFGWILDLFLDLCDVIIGKMGQVGHGSKRGFHELSQNRMVWIDNVTDSSYLIGWICDIIDSENFRPCDFVTSHGSPTKNNSKTCDKKLFTFWVGFDKKCDVWKTLLGKFSG